MEELNKFRLKGLAKILTRQRLDRAREFELEKRRKYL
jgi:hypothetical protein